MKRVFLLFIICFQLVSTCFAETISNKTVGIFLEAPVTYVNNETVRRVIPEKAKKIFSSDKFTIIPFADTEMAARIYKEDNRMNVNQYFSQPFNRMDIQKISKDLNCDYALFITISNGPPRASSNLFSVSFKTSVTCDVRLLNIETGKYIVNKQIVKDGSSTSVLGAPSFDHAYNEALEKALSELVIDTSTL